MLPETDFSTILKAITFKITNEERRLYFRSKRSDRLKTLGLNQTIYEFTRSMWQALKIHRPNLKFEPAYPSYVLDKEDSKILNPERHTRREIPDEIMTWNVIRRSPAGLKGPFSTEKALKPRVREELVYDSDLVIDPPDPETHDGPGQIGSTWKEQCKVIGQEVKGQYFDNLIQFDIWSKNNRKAEELCEYLEDFMSNFESMFRKLGIIQMFFHSRVRDEVILNWRNGLVNRSLIYYLKTEKVTSEPVREIKSITVDLRFHKSIQKASNDIDAFKREIENQMMIDWINRNRR